MKIVNFRVDETEHKLMQAICESQGHTVSSYIRAHFKTKAVELGITVDPLAELRVSAQRETPKAQPIPVPVQTKPQVRHVVVADEVTLKPKPAEEFLPNKWAHLPEPDLKEDNPFA